MTPQLPLTLAQQTALFQILDAFEAAGARPVLIGGLVPPLLMAALGEEVEWLMPSARQTRDCDVVIHVAVADGTRDLTHSDAVNIVNACSFSHERRRTNQFRYIHPSGLKLDLIPVPMGVEAGDARALAMARGFEIDQPREFYRGCEMALEDFVAVEVTTTPPRLVRLANFVPLLVMKLQAWHDRGHIVARDAHDVGYVVRHTPLAHLAREIRRHQSGKWSSTVAAALQRLAGDFQETWSPGARAYGRERVSYDEDAREQEQLGLATAVTELLAALKASPDGLT